MILSKWKFFIPRVVHDKQASRSTLCLPLWQSRPFEHPIRWLIFLVFLKKKDYGSRVLPKIEKSLNQLLSKF